MSGAIGTIAVVVLIVISVPSSSPPANRPGLGADSFVAEHPVSLIQPVDVDRRKIQTLEQLLALPAEERAEVDIARANLLVAKASPGGEQIDINATLEVIDAWAQAVAIDTDRHLYKYRADPADFENSEGYFRMLSLVTVLQQDAGVIYNPERITAPDFTNPADLFIHGMIPVDGSIPSGGTCVSMPVLYTAIARRLGYPVHLVTTKAHVFARWDDGKGERFNIEGSGRGMGNYDDEHYKAWPMPITEREIADCGYLKNLDSDEELAIFVSNMGHVYADTGRGGEAMRVYQTAMALDPDNMLYRGFVGSVTRQIDALPSQLGDPARRVGDRQPTDPLEHVRQVQELNRRNRDANGIPGGP